MESDFVANVRKSAEEHFASGMFCAESVVLAVAESQGVDYEGLPRIATAFCSGMGRTCGPCGALTGAVMGISLALGRTNGNESAMPSYLATQKIVQEFEKEFGSRDCHVLLGCDLGTPEGQVTFREDKLGRRCAHFTSKAAEMAGRIIMEAQT